VRENPKIRDAHRSCVIRAAYRSAYPRLPSLRPELQLELIQRPLLLPTERIEFGYLHEMVAGLKPTETVAIDCISVSETAAEKVLSFLRRCAGDWAGLRFEDDIDSALVRHVHDVARIAEQTGEALAAARDIFPQLVARERIQFKGQNPAFDADPVGVLGQTLQKARTNTELRQQYMHRVVPLIYGATVPSYDQCFATFEVVAGGLLSAC
jgi:hypothetical protein